MSRGRLPGRTGVRYGALPRRGGLAVVVRRAALPHELLVPRRGEPSRGARRGGGPPGPRCARRHRPRRLLRRRPLRGGGPRGGAADRLRRRADPRGAPPGQRGRRPPGRAPPRARPGAARLRPPRPGDQRGAAGRREGRARASPSRRWPRRRAPGCDSPTVEPAPRNDAWLCSPGAARGRCPPRCSRRPRRGRVARSSGWSTRSDPTGCSSSSGTTAIRSTVTATTRSPRSRRAPGSKSSPPTTCTTPPAPDVRSPPRWLRSGPAAPSTRSTAGFPARRSPTSAAPGRAARRFARWPGAVERTVEVAAPVRVRPAARRARPARPRRARRVHRDVVAARARPPGCRGALPAEPSATTSRRCTRSPTSSA